MATPPKTPSLAHKTHQAMQVTLCGPPSWKDEAPGMVRLLATKPDIRTSEEEVQGSPRRVVPEPLLARQVSVQRLQAPLRLSIWEPPLLRPVRLCTTGIYQRSQVTACTRGLLLQSPPQPCRLCLSRQPQRDHSISMEQVRAPTSKVESIGISGLLPRQHRQHMDVHRRIC